MMAEVRLLESLEKNGKQVVDEDGNGTGGSFFGVAAHTALAELWPLGASGGASAGFCTGRVCTSTVLVPGTAVKSLVPARF